MDMIDTSLKNWLPKGSGNILDRNSYGTEILNGSSKYMMLEATEIASATSWLMV